MQLHQGLLHQAAPPTASPTSVATTARSLRVRRGRLDDMSEVDLAQLHQRAAQVDHSVYRWSAVGLDGLQAILRALLLHQGLLRQTSRSTPSSGTPSTTTIFLYGRLW